MEILNFTQYLWVVNPQSIFPIPAPPPPWILSTGSWVDESLWVDTETWEDGV